MLLGKLTELDESLQLQTSKYFKALGQLELMLVIHLSLLFRKHVKNIKASEFTKPFEVL